jgi:membrane protein DedA with SNARE-associated domain
MIGFIRAHADWVVPILLVMGFFKSLAIVSLVVPETLMVAMIAALEGTGRLSLWSAWLAVAAGSALGDWASYEIGRRLEDRARHLWPFTRRPDLIPRGERFFHRWGAMSVVLCRFFSPLRATVPLLCGIFQMPRWIFQAANLASAALWAAVLVLVGKGLLDWVVPAAVRLSHAL